MFGQIAGAIIGGIASRNAAKKQASATQYAADKANQGYDDAREYITGMYAGGQGALDDALATGAYAGPTYASLNPTQMEGFDYLSGFGRNAMGQGENFMNQGGGFGSNFQDIYNRAAGPTLDNAIGYATSSPQAQSLVDAAMRDSRRRLEEQTVPGIGLSASASNNTNSSRAGVTEAIAQRAFDDREADVRGDVFRDLTNQYLRSNSQDLTNMTRANEGLKNTYGIGFGMGPQAANMLSQAGGAMQTDQQNQMNADREAFERERDFALNQYAKFNAGVLNNAPQAASYLPNTIDPNTAALGGAMTGFGFGGKYLNDLFKPQQAQTPGFGFQPGMSGFIDAPAYVGYGFTGGR